jgi:hypothetical protein
MTDQTPAERLEMLLCTDRVVFDPDADSDIRAALAQLDDALAENRRLRGRHDAVWAVVAALRATAAAEGRDPYQDPTAQDLSAALVGATQPDPEGREWGRRFWDGTAGPEESRQSALATAARFKPGYVELVHRDGPDAEWVRAADQPHTAAERIDALADHVEFLRQINHWRGQRLVELGEHPNPPKDWAAAELLRDDTTGGAR